MNKNWVTKRWIIGGIILIAIIAFAKALIGRFFEGSQALIITIVVVLILLAIYHFLPRHWKI